MASFELLRSATAELPLDPWLFYPEGMDWRWIPFGVGVRRVERLAATLRALPVGTRVGFLDAARPLQLMVDLAIQAAGLISVPCQGAVAQQRLGAWVEVEPGGERPSGIPVFTVAPLAASPWEPPVALAEPFVPRAGGGVEVAEPGQAAPLTWTEVPAVAMPAAGAHRRMKRDVIVLGTTLRSGLNRRLLGWALAQRAAILLPGSAPWWGAAAWARASVLAGTASDLDALKAVPGADQPAIKWPRSPFGRLRAFLLGGPPPSEQALGYWRERGVAVVAVAS